MVSVVFLCVFQNCPKSLVYKDLRQVAPPPEALSAYAQRTYVNFLNLAGILLQCHHAIRTHARTLRGERKGIRFRYTHRFRIVPHTLAVQR